MKGFLKKHGIYLVILLVLFLILTIVLIKLAGSGDRAFDYLIY